MPGPDAPQVVRREGAVGWRRATEPDLGEVDVRDRHVGADLPEVHLEPDGRLADGGWAAQEQHRPTGGGRQLNGRQLNGRQFSGRRIGERRRGGRGPAGGPDLGDHLGHRQATGVDDQVGEVGPVEVPPVPDALLQQVQQPSAAFEPGPQLVGVGPQAAHRHVGSREGGGGGGGGGGSGQAGDVAGDPSRVVDQAADHQLPGTRGAEAGVDAAQVARLQAVVARIVGGRRVAQAELVEVDIGRVRAQLLEQRIPDGGLAHPGRAAQPQDLDHPRDGSGTLR
ncbi:hypothetical protein GCM10009558_017120 [Virgisporangium aurantiacum]